MQASSWKDNCTNKRAHRRSKGEKSRMDKYARVSKDNRKYPKVQTSILSMVLYIPKSVQSFLLLFFSFFCFFHCVSLLGAGVGSVLSAGGIGNDLKWPIKSKKQTEEETKLWTEAEPI